MSEFPALFSSSPCHTSESWIGCVCNGGIPTDWLFPFLKVKHNNDCTSTGVLLPLLLNKTSILFGVEHKSRQIQDRGQLCLQCSYSWPFYFNFKICLGKTILGWLDRWWCFYMKIRHNGLVPVTFLLAHCCFSAHWKHLSSQVAILHSKVVSVISPGARLPMKNGWQTFMKNQKTVTYRSYIQISQMYSNFLEG